MIKATPESVPLERETELRKWLARTEAQTLLAVGEAKVKLWEVKALSDALMSSSSNNKIESANANLLTAQRYDAFCTVLREFMSQTAPFTLTKLT